MIPGVMSAGWCSAECDLKKKEEHCDGNSGAFYYSAWTMSDEENILHHNNYLVGTYRFDNVSDVIDFIKNDKTGLPFGIIKLELLKDGEQHWTRVFRKGYEPSSEELSDKGRAYRIIDWYTRPEDM